ncbi:MAG: hypothetical protein ACOYUK_02160 [Patescibacteria group bacterium]
MIRTIEQRQPQGKFEGIFDEVRQELDQFKMEMERQKAILRGTGVLDRDE